MIDKRSVYTLMDLKRTKLIGKVFVNGANVAIAIDEEHRLPLRKMTLSLVKILSDTCGVEFEEGGERGRL